VAPQHSRASKDLKIVALDTVSDFLKRNERSGSIVTNVTFKTAKKLTLGGKTVELSRRDYHSNEGDLFIYVPQAKFLMALIA